MRRWISLILFIASIVLLSISIYSLMGMFREYKQADELNERLQQIHDTAVQPDESEETAPTPRATSKPFVTPAPEEASVVESEEEAANQTIPAREVDAGLLALHEENPDCIYWLTIPDTVIDYPVMFRPQDKDYYLRRDFYGDYSGSGTLYMDEDCDPEWGDNLIIYGHHMNNGTMFAALENYKSREFYEAHPQITLQTLHGEETYRVMAVFTTPVYTGNDFAYYNFTVTGDPTVYENFVRECLSRSLYETGETAVYGRRLLTLSTCEYSQKNGRMVVVAVRVHNKA